MLPALAVAAVESEPSAARLPASSVQPEHAAETAKAQPERCAIGLLGFQSGWQQLGRSFSTARRLVRSMDCSRLAVHPRLAGTAYLLGHAMASMGDAKHSSP